MRGGLGGGVRCGVVGGRAIYARQAKMYHEGKHACRRNRCKCEKSIETCKARIEIQICATKWEFRPGRGWRALGASVGGVSHRA